MTILSEAPTERLLADRELAKSQYAQACDQRVRMPACKSPLQYEEADRLDADKARYRGRIDRVTAELNKRGVYTEAEFDRLRRAAAGAELLVAKVERSIERAKAIGIVTTSLERQLGNAQKRLVEARGRVAVAELGMASQGAEAVTVVLEVEEVA